MTSERNKKLVEYWTKTAEHDYDTMASLFDLKRYSDCLFFGHIVLEKILKGHVVRCTEEDAPYIHNLTVLARLVKDIEFSSEEMDLFADVNEFNISSRYPDYKFLFYKKCTLSYTKKYFKKISEEYKFLCQQLTPKK